MSENSSLIFSLKFAFIGFFLGSITTQVVPSFNPLLYLIAHPKKDNESEIDETPSSSADETNRKDCDNDAIQSRSSTKSNQHASANLVEGDSTNVGGNKQKIPLSSINETPTSIASCTASPASAPATPTSATVAAAINDNHKTPVKLVLQRFRYGRLLVHDDEQVDKSNDNDGSVAAATTRIISFGTKSNMDETSFTFVSSNAGDTDHTNSKTTPSPGGILVYISFAKGSQKSMISNAVNTVLNMPIMTLGQWGDGKKAQSILKIASLLYNLNKEQGEGKTNSTNSVSVVIVPQANLVSKVKNNGKSIQYHDQIGKDEGYELFHLFIDTMKKAVLEHQKLLSEQNTNGTTKKSKPSKNTKIDTSVNPIEMFRTGHSAKLFSAWDEQTGMPLLDIHGEKISKSAYKRIKKLYDSQTKRYEKFIREKEMSISSTLVVPSTTGVEAVQNSTVKTTENTPSQAIPATTIKKSNVTNVIEIVHGTYGKRQALEFTSDMGPLCYTLMM